MEQTSETAASGTGAAAGAAPAAAAPDSGNQNYITRDMVKNAVSSLKLQNRKPTIAEIRKVLGNKGSYSTISKWLNELRKEAEPSADPEKSEAAVILAESASRTVQDLWELALGEMKKVYEKKIRDLNAEIAILNENRDELCKEIDALREQSRLDGELIKKNNLQLGEARGTADSVRRTNEQIMEMVKSILNLNQRNVTAGFADALRDSDTPNSGLPETGHS